MSDLIRREDAIKRATEEHDFYRGASLPTDKARRDELLNVMCWLNELPPAEPGREKWIPVTERLPEETGLYLISIKTKGVEALEEIYPDGLVYVSAYDAVIMHWGYGEKNVQAWMPLPKPYQEGNKW